MTTSTPDPTGSGGQRVYYSDATLTLLVGDAVDQTRTLPDGSVDCVVTSPPYWRQRDYGHPDQLGQEPTPAQFVASLVEVGRSIRRILASDGTFWLNLGDSYVSGPTGPRRSSGLQGRPQAMTSPVGAGDRRGAGLPEKSLTGIPWRVALALQDDGWLLRSAVVWHQTTAVPEPVRDRPARRHEFLFLLTRSPKYHFDLDAIRVPHTGRNKTGKGLHPAGRNPGDVWVLPRTSIDRIPGHHEAPFPVSLPLRCIAAGCKPGGRVLDLFSGVGTTVLAAQQLGRRAIGIDLNAAYHDIALRRMATATIPFGEPA